MGILLYKIILNNKKIYNVKSIYIIEVLKLIKELIIFKRKILKKNLSKKNEIFNIYSFIEKENEFYLYKFLFLFIKIFRILIKFLFFHGRISTFYFQYFVNLLLKFF